MTCPGWGVTAGDSPQIIAILATNRLDFGILHFTDGRPSTLDNYCPLATLDGV